MKCIAAVVYRSFWLVLLPALASSQDGPLLCSRMQGLCLIEQSGFLTCYESCTMINVDNCMLLILRCKLRQHSRLLALLRPSVSP